MEDWIVLGSALWLGIMASISPCTIVTNIAAVSFLAKRVTHPVLVFISGLSYSLGRVVTYAALGYLFINSFLSIPQVAQFLQKYMPQALGPFLIITGLVLIEKIRIKMPGVILSHKHHGKLMEAGVPGSFLLGLIFALAFCPVSAALFFGSLIPLAINTQKGSVLFFIYGIGTSLPVLIFSVAIAVGVTSLNHWMHKISRFEYYTRKITGFIFIIAGLYYAGAHIFRLF